MLLLSAYFRTKHKTWNTNYTNTPTSSLECIALVHWILRASKSGGKLFAPARTTSTNNNKIDANITPNSKQQHHHKNHLRLRYDILKMQYRNSRQNPCVQCIRCHTGANVRSPLYTHTDIFIVTRNRIKRAAIVDMGHMYTFHGAGGALDDDVRCGLHTHTHTHRSSNALSIPSIYIL